MEYVKQKSQYQKINNNKYDKLSTEQNQAEIYKILRQIDYDSRVQKKSFPLYLKNFFFKDYNFTR